MTSGPPRSTEATPESRTAKKIKRLWQLGDLFHNCTRYPRKRGLPKIDRLAGILKRGLVAPAACSEGVVRSDLNIVATGFSVAYDSLVFLHRFGEPSWLYTMCEPGRFTVFVDPALPVLTSQDLGPNWVELSQDEVYVKDGVGTENLIGIAVYPTDAEAILGEFLDDFRRLEIPLYDYDSNVLWPKSGDDRRGRARRS